MTVKTLSLFSGAGGLDIGFHRAGFDIVACVEIENKYAASLRSNVGKDRFFGDSTQVFCQDVWDFDVEQFRDRDIECVIGGPPCQTFSAAGRRSGGVVGTSDKRGQLFERFVEVLATLKPEVFVFENVYGLPGANGGGPWLEITSAFSKLGYTLRSEVVDAADYGVPQHRERLILVGSKRGDFQFPNPTHGPDSLDGRPLFSVFEAIQDLQDLNESEHAGPGGMYGHLLPLVPPGMNYSFFTAEMGHPEPVFAWRSKFHDLLYKVDPNFPCRTLKAQPGKFTGPFHWKNRHFTLPELKRLQTFPDEYHLEGSNAHVLEQIGNSVPPRLAEVVAVSVREQLFEQTDSLTYGVRPLGFQSTFRTRQRERAQKFKDIAKAAISAQYKSTKGKPSKGIAVFDESYWIVARDLFDTEILKEAKKALNTRQYSVDVKDKGDALKITINGGAKTQGKARCTIGIDGLKKYMGRVDSLELVAFIDDSVDAFHVWGAIERALVTRSQFFSLIDIYGHYANRGDTVKVKSNYGLNSAHPLHRALDLFGNSKECGGFWETGLLCAELEVSKLELETVIDQLRELRIDIRDSRSHPIVGENRVLCTYPFPLLSKRALVVSKVEFLERKNKLAS
jgi:DNA (cytosine-5)-methyltransferase 1